MEKKARLSRVLALIEERGWSYTYNEEDGLGSIDFDYRGVPYHIWADIMDFQLRPWSIEDAEDIAVEADNPRIAANLFYTSAL